MAQRTESPRESSSRCRGQVPGRQQGIRRRFSERRCPSRQNCDCQISLFSCGVCYKKLQFKSMPQPGVQLFDIRNALAYSDKLALGRIVGLPEADALSEPNYASLLCLDDNVP